MLETILDIYMNYIEKNLAYEKNKDKVNNIWNKAKKHEKILNMASQIQEDNFVSNIIVQRILTDKDLYNTEVYKNIVNKILSNENLAKIKIGNHKSFLILILQNTNLELTKEQKLFLVEQASKTPFSKKYYESIDKVSNSDHGIGILDIRYLILINKNFSIQERKNLLVFFYPDDELKASILEEIEWNISRTLNIEDVETIYDIKLSELKINNTLKKEIDRKIELCKYIKSIISEEIINRKGL